MPLSHGKSQKSISKNIETEQKAGKKHDQAVAIALNEARENGANIPKMADGGAPHVTFMENESPDKVKETVHLAHMAEGGEVMPQESGIITMLRNYMMNHRGTGVSDQNDVAAANAVDQSTGTATGYADGGAPMDPKDVVGLPGVPVPSAPMNPVVAAGLPGVPALPSVEHKEPSDDEKRKLVEKALKEKSLKLDDGGAIDPSQLPQPLPADAPQNSKLQTILNALKMGGQDALKSIELGTPASDAATQVSTAAANSPMAAQIASAAPSVANAALGTNFTENPPLPVQSAAAQPTNTAATASQTQAASKAPVTTAAPTPDPLAQLGKFDPTTVAPGMNAPDRQALAAQVQGNQHSFGNLVAEAMAGLGDALATRGGVQQNSLGSIISLEKQQRDEALGNFDKAREIAVQNHTMKNQADQDLINNVKARGEMLVSPSIAQSMGHPEWANKPTAQVALALSGQKAALDYTNNLMQRKQAALKDAADSVDQALKSGGIGGTQKMMDPQSRLNMIYTTARANDPEAFGWTAKKIKD